MSKILAAGAALREYRRQVGELTVGELRQRARFFAREAELDVWPGDEGRTDWIVDAVIAAASEDIPEAAPG